MPSKASIAGGGVAGGGIGAEAAFGGVSKGLAMAKAKAGDVLGGIFGGGVPWNLDPFEIVRAVGGAGEPGVFFDGTFRVLEIGTRVSLDSIWSVIPA